MKRRNKIIVGIGVLVIGGFAAAGVLGMNQSAKANSNILGPKGGQVIKVAMAEQTDIQSKVAASGMLETQEESVVYAEANNQVAQVHKKVGDAAVKGEVVISFENTTSDKLKRELEKLELQLETAQLALNQLQTASKGDLLSAQSNVASLEK